MSHIKYKAGYKYQLIEDCITQTGVYPDQDIKTKYIELTIDGLLTLKSGYASDGPSGPTIDSKTFMRGAFFHDGLYQLMRMGLLDLIWRRQADKELKRICLEDGMWKRRAEWVYKGVRVGANSAALPKNRKKIYIAP